MDFFACYDDIPAHVYCPNESLPSIVLPLSGRSHSLPASFHNNFLRNNASYPACRSPLVTSSPRDSSCLFSWKRNQCKPNTPIVREGQHNVWSLRTGRRQEAAGPPCFGACYMHPCACLHYLCALVRSKRPSSYRRRPHDRLPLSIYLSYLWGSQVGSFPVGVRELQQEEREIPATFGSHAFPFGLLNLCFRRHRCLKHYCLKHAFWLAASVCFWPLSLSMP